MSFSSVSFGISFEHAVQLPFTVFLYSPFPDNYAFLSLSPSQIKNIQSADTVPVHGHSPLVFLVEGKLITKSGGGKRGRPESGRRHNNRRRRREEARAEESHSQEEGQPEKRPRTERSDTEREAAGGEAGPSQSHCKKGHMTNLYLTDSDKAIMDFVQDHEEMYDKTSEHFKDKVRKEFL